MSEQNVTEGPPPMQQYIGTKIIGGEPMDEVTFLTNIKGKSVNQDTRPGYHVLYQNPDGSTYDSWSPKDVFELAYRKTDGMNFGLAVEAMKMGKKCAREGWNGKNMYAVIMPGYPEGIEVNEATQKAHNIPEGTKLVFRPYLQLYTAQSDVAMWAPSGSDALADDWQLVED